MLTKATRAAATKRDWDAEMAYFGFGSKKMRFVDIETPHPSSDRGGLAIVVIVLDVEPYIKEWLTFHLAAGAELFVIYDNGCTDGTLSILQGLEFKKRVTVIPWRLRLTDQETQRNLSPQISAYAHAVTTFGSGFLRMAFIDIDEFLVPRGQDTILASVLALGDISNISLPWHMFGHNGHKRRPAGGVVQNFTSRTATPYKKNSTLIRFKCIVDPCRVQTVAVHEFETTDMPGHTSNMIGDIVPHHKRKQDRFFTSDGMQLNHYYLLSEEEFENKMKRGPVHYASKSAYRKRLLKKIREIEADTQPDYSAVDFLRKVGWPK